MGDFVAVLKHYRCLLVAGSLLDAIKWLHCYVSVCTTLELAVRVCCSAVQCSTVQLGIPFCFGLVFAHCRKMSLQCTQTIYGGNRPFSRRSLFPTCQVALNTGSHFSRRRGFILCLVSSFVVSHRKLIMPFSASQLNITVYFWGQIYRRKL